MKIVPRRNNEKRIKKMNTSRCPYGCDADMIPWDRTGQEINELPGFQCPVCCAFYTREVWFKLKEGQRVNEEIPKDFYKSLDDFKKGRIVDLGTALNESSYD